VINNRISEGEQCPRVAEQEDVTITTPVELLLEGLDFNLDLKATLRFTELNDDSQVTTRIVSVEASIVGTDILRTFNVDDKLKLMSYEASRITSMDTFEDSQKPPLPLVTRFILQTRIISRVRRQMFLE